MALSEPSELLTAFSDVVRNQLAAEPEPSLVPDAQPSRDPWAHRSLGMRCHTCMWWAEKPAPEPGLHALGRCRRHAPTMNGFPAVYDDDWCGDHKLTESIR